MDDNKPASARALGTVEILSIILQYAIDPEDIDPFWRKVEAAEVRFVNKLWYHQASKLYFESCDIELLERILRLEEETDQDLSSLVKSVAVDTGDTWEGFADLLLKNMVHLRITICDVNILELPLVRQSCPGANRIDLYGSVRKLVTYLPASVATFPHALLDIVEISVEESIDSSKLETLLRMIEDQKVNQIELHFSNYWSSSQKLTSYFDTLRRFPSLLPRVSSVSMLLDPPLVCKLAQWGNLCNLFPCLNSFDLSVYGREGDPQPRILSKSVLQLLENGNCIKELHLDIVMLGAPDDWIEKLADSTPNLRCLDLKLYSKESLLGVGLFRSLKTCRSLQEVTIANYECAGDRRTNDYPFGLAAHQFDVNDPEVWFPCLRTLAVQSEVDKSEFKRLVFHHMPQLSCLEVYV